MKCFIFVFASYLKINFNSIKLKRIDVVKNGHVFMALMMYDFYCSEWNQLVDEIV